MFLGSGGTQRIRQDRRKEAKIARREPVRGRCGRPLPGWARDV